VQLDHIKPTLKAPATKRLKLKHDKLLSNVAFKFKLRRYTMDELNANRPTDAASDDDVSDDDDDDDDAGEAGKAVFHKVKVGRCRLAVSNPDLTAPLISAIETEI
jgi:hypothetical protein